MYSLVTILRTTALYIWKFERGDLKNPHHKNCNYVMWLMLIKLILVIIFQYTHISMQGTWVWCLGQNDPLEKERVAHSSILAWKIPWTEEAGGLQSMESWVRHNLVTKPPPLYVVYLKLLCKLYFNKMFRFFSHHQLYHKGYVPSVCNGQDQLQCLKFRKTGTILWLWDSSQQDLALCEHFKPSMSL